MLLIPDTYWFITSYSEFVELVRLAWNSKGYWGMAMIFMMNCFCGMVDRQKAFSLISSRDHYQRSSPSRISDTLWAGFEPVQNLSSGLVEWSCAVVITTMTDLKGAATFKMKLVVIIVFKGWQLWTILTESSILDLTSPVPQNGAF